MDELKMQAQKDVTSSVARDFEPTRIERQLLARAFDLLCEFHSRPTSTSHASGPPVAEDPMSASFDERSVA